MAQLFFTQLFITFKVEEGSVTGNSIFKELSGSINTDLAESQVDENGVEIWFVTTEGSKQIEDICEEVKTSLEKSFGARLSYKIVSIDL